MKFFRNIAKLRFGVPIKCRKYGHKRNNNCIKRVRREVKQGYCTMIEFKKVKSANAVLDFFDMYDNCISKIRSERGNRWRTPAERADIKLDLGETHQFLNLMMALKTK